MPFSPSSSPRTLPGLVKILPLPIKQPRFSRSSIHLRCSRSVSVSLRVLPKVIWYLSYLCIKLIASLGCELLGGLWGLRLCLISVTIRGGLAWLNLIQFLFPQSCPSLNLWSSILAFPKILLFLTCKPLHILFPLHGILLLKGNQIHPSRPTPKPPGSHWPKQPLFIPHWSLSLSAFTFFICPTRL